MFKLHKITEPTLFGTIMYNYIFSKDNQILGHLFGEIDEGDEYPISEEQVRKDFLHLYSLGKLTPEGDLKFPSGVEIEEIKLDDYLVKQTLREARLNEMKDDFEKEKEDA